MSTPATLLDPQLAALASGGPNFITETTRSANGSLAEFYEENGYLVVPDALSQEELQELRAEALRICKGEAGEVRGFEPNVPGESDDDVLRRYLCIHFPHKISDVMLKYLATPGMTEVLTEIIGPDVKCMQSMLFIKSTGKPGQAWHQDEDFIPTRDRSLTGGWIAMDDATIENGCLWVIPGSHKPGLLWPLEVQEDTRFDCTDEAAGFPYTDDGRHSGRGQGGQHRLLQRLSAAPLLPQPRPERLSPRAGQPLHERVVAAALASAQGRRTHGHRRLSRYRHGCGERPVQLEGDD